MEENGLRSLNNLHSLRHLKCLHLGMNRIVEVRAAHVGGRGGKRGFRSYNTKRVGGRES